MKFSIAGLLLSSTLSILGPNGSAYALQCNCYSNNKCVLDNVTSSDLRDVEEYCPQAKMKNMQYLSIFNFYEKILLENIFNTYTNLISMNFYEGSIQRIEPGAFEKLSKLIKLSVQEHNITLLEDYTFYGLGALKELDLETNKLKSIAPRAFDGLKSLERLYLSENSLTHLPNEVFDNIGYLYVLDVSFNRLKSFIYPNLKAEKLSLHYNSLTRLHINDHVRFVQAQHNRIRTISGTGSNATDLLLNDNAISDVTPITRMTSLTKLILNHNPLQPDSVFASLTNLKGLLLKNTSIQISESTFANLSSMILLDLSFNNLTQLDLRMFSSMIDLEALIVAYNHIQMINFIELREYLPKLQILEICDNGWNATNTEHMLLQMKHHRLFRYREKNPKTSLFREFFTDICLLISDRDYLEEREYLFNYNFVSRGHVSEELYPTSSPSPAHEDPATNTPIHESTTTTTPPAKPSDLEPTLAVSLNITNTMPSVDHVAPDDHLKVEGLSPLYVVFQVLVYTLGVVFFVLLGYYVRQRHFNERLTTPIDSSGDAL